MEKTILDHLNIVVKDAFAKAGFSTDIVSVQKSDRPDLADFQCNAALQMAREAKMPPRGVAEKVVAELDQSLFDKVEIAGPGFINLVVKNDFLSALMTPLQNDERAGLREEAGDQTIIIDYGGPNVAKPLHVGHLRPSIIGEAVKRTARYMGHYIIGDIHLGDWGTPMGMLIAELQERHPEWPYFDASKTDGYPEESPIAVEALTTLYPEASTHFKEDEEFADKARQATAELQDGRPGYRALWRHFVDISLQTVKDDLGRLNVDFDLWLGESDVHDLIPEMIQDMRDKGLIVEDNGALIIHVAEEGDKEEIPPVIVVKKDGGYNYATTDLATIYDRKKKYNPNKLLYVVDTRQSLHFKQVFRAAAKAGYMPLEAMEHINFGTLNGKDGKPFKTRAGGVMRLTQLIAEARNEALEKSGYGADDNLPDEIEKMTDKIAIAAIKYGDLSVSRQSDYNFDLSSFLQTEGKTGPYIQYAAVRIRSILEKAGALDEKTQILITDDTEKELALKFLEFNDVVAKAFEHSMPSVLCEHVFLLAKAFNRFYRQCQVLNEEDKALRMSRLKLCAMVLRQITIIMETMLAIDMPQKMLRLGDEKEEAA